MSTVVITNPNGHRVQRHLTRLTTGLQPLGNLEHCITNDLAALDAVLDQQDWRAQDLIVINGGDGTVQHLLTRLLAQQPADTLPTLAILPGGTTNMTAFDFNRSRSYRGSLSRLLKGLGGAHVDHQQRDLLQVRNGTDQQVGVFFGAAAVLRGIEYFDHRLQSPGVRSEWGVGLVVLRAAWGMARRQPPFAAATQIRLSGLGEYSTLILLVTSLQRLVVGARPFWGREPGRLHLTLVEQKAPRFLRNLPRLISGRPGRALTPEHGYHSCNLDRVALELDGSFTIDGEIFPTHGNPIELSALGPIRILRL